MAYIKIVKTKDAIPNVDPKKHIGKKVRVSYGTSKRDSFGKIAKYNWTPVFGGEYVIKIDGGGELVIPATKLFTKSDSSARGVYLEDKNK